MMKSPRPRHVKRIDLEYRRGGSQQFECLVGMRQRLLGQPSRSNGLGQVEKRYSPIVLVAAARLERLGLVKNLALSSRSPSTDSDATMIVPRAIMLTAGSGWRACNCRAVRTDDSRSPVSPSIEARLASASWASREVLSTGYASTAA